MDLAVPVHCWPLFIIWKCTCDWCSHLSFCRRCMHSVFIFHVRNIFP